jgi:tetratricopeptide (TPR) repeat protein
MIDNPGKIKVSTLCLLLLGFVSLYAQEAGEESSPRIALTGAISDSNFQGFTLDELAEFQDYYRAETERLLKEKEQLRRRGMQEMEVFTKSHPNSSIMDKVIIRLATLLYEQISQDFIVANDKYSDLLDKYYDGEIPTAPEEPVKDYGRVLALYDQIINDFPDSKLVDDAIYLTGYIFEEMGEREEAYGIFEDLVAKAPDSEYAADALMRMAEYNFNPPVNDLQKSIALYNQVLEHKESPKYDAALYRLGWVYYKLNDYPSAISYFTTLADDVNRFKDSDPENKYHFPEVHEEGVEYIGISFMDFGGTERAAKYFDEIGGREYGFQVLQKIGDTYLDVKEEFANAIEAYQLILSLYPDSPKAPEVEAQLADAYRKAENQRMAYASRSELFNKYQADGDWWSKIDDPEARKRATAIASAALRENINMSLTKAEETKDASLYEQAITDSRDYLEAFPSDSHSVQVHWNMALILDTKLSKHEDAFAEYVKISTEYWDAEFQQQAAANAVALADEAVRKEQELSAPPSTSTDPYDTAATKGSTPAKSELVARAFTENEQRLVEAINNYVKLFPHDKETATMLSKAGGLYYERNQFQDAIKYFKTVGKHFPESEEADYAQYLTMESYFGKSDFESAEVIARQLKNRSPEYATKAGQRLSQTMFLRAKSFADSSDHLAAAQQFERMALEVPTSEFADLALYNAAISLEGAKEYEKAVQTYTRLIDNYPQSENFVNALNNLAFDYRELQDYHNAAKTYERLFDVQEGKEEAQVALYNSSVSYVQAQEWMNAIRVNSKYVTQYPGAEDAENLLFNNAQYYFKLNDVRSANQIYKDFATRYPGSPRSVEASYHRGMYFLENHRLAEAKADLNKAIRLNTKLEKAGKETNNHFAAEGLYQLTEITFDEFKDIEFRLPANSLTRNKDSKKRLLSELTDNYTRIAAYGTVRLYKATYRIGESYEEFARAWAKQDVVETDPNKRIVAENQIFSNAADLYEKAVEAYKDGAKIIAKFSDTQAISDPSADTDSGKLAVADTARMEGEKWLARSQEKISENLYTIAEMKFLSIDKLVHAPVPPGLKKLEQLVYRHQVLAKAVQPIVTDITAAHIRNINEANQLRLENSWVESSKDRIVEVSNLIPNEYRKLSRETLLGYQNVLSPYQELIESGDEASFDLADEMGNYVELSKTLSLAASSGFRNNLAAFKDVQAAEERIAATGEDLMQSLFEQATLMNSLSTNADVQRKRFEDLFTETEKLDYEDAFLNFDEKHFALAEAATELLELGFQTQQELGVQNSWAQRINIALVQSNPEQYAANLGMEVKSEMIGSSSEWMVSSNYQQGWTKVEFADNHWSNAHDEGPSGELKGSDSKAIWLVNINPAQLARLDSSGSVRQVSTVGASATDMTTLVDRPDKVYFRKSFDVEGLPVSGIVQLFLDDSFALYVNGEFVADYKFEDNSERAIHTFEISDYLTSGTNVLAVEATDLDDSRGSLEAALEIKNLPDWFQVQKQMQKTGGDDGRN